MAPRIIDSGLPMQSEVQSLFGLEKGFSSSIGHEVSDGMCRQLRDMTRFVTGNQELA